MVEKYKNKIICVDWSVFLKASAHASLNSGMLPTYTAVTMILGNLTKIGVSSDDLVLICCDYMGSWRKEYIPSTKVDRKEIENKFQETFPGIYQKFDNLLDQLDEATNWHICKEPAAEADDWMAIAAKYYTDCEVVALTIDSDVAQLWHYSNFKWFSPHRKMKRYKVKPPKFNVYAEIEKLINTKGHNNLGIPTTPEERENKRLCVDMINLPEWIEEICIARFKEIKPKQANPELLKSQTLIDRYNSLNTSSDKIITYENSCKLVEKRKKRAKNKGRK